MSEGNFRALRRRVRRFLPSRGSIRTPAAIQEMLASEGSPALRAQTAREKPRQNYKHQPDRDARVAIQEQIADTQNALQKRFFEYALDSIDFDRFAEIQAAALKQKGLPVKHLDLAHFLYWQFRRAIKAGFAERVGLNSLDLGCGIGTFSFAQKFLGHNVIGLDRPNTFFFDDMTSLLGITKLHHTIRSMEPLPPIFGLDVITAYSAAFPKKSDDACFTEQDWTFFFEDLKARLNPGGCILLRINDMYDLEGLHPTAPEFGRLVESHGGQADLEKRIVTFGSL